MKSGTRIMDSTLTSEFYKREKGVTKDTIEDTESGHS